MKKLIFCLAILTFFVACEPSASSDNFARIAGQVVDEDTGTSIEGANIDLSPSGGNNSGIYSGSDGYFDIKDLDPIQYTVSVRKSGYNSNRKIVNTVAGEVTNVTIPLKRKE